jgi:4-diphosphocytidyl-2-C-methyl-D-erythritol kinase
MDAADTAFAKINLALHVRKREADGYHAIETLFAFAEDGDRLSLTPEPGLQVIGPFAAGLTEGDNLVTRAAAGFADLTGRPIEGGFLLDKRLPVAAGLGGGSADAAAALRLLCARDFIDPNERGVRELAASLGADVPACLVSRPVRGEGRGDVLTRLEGVPGGQALLLVNPMRPLATGPVFAHWDGVDRGPLDPGDPIAAATAGRNDLEPPAIAILPVIGEILALLGGQEGVILARMSGSGATCFALFEDDAARDMATSDIAADHPDWWLLPTRLR